MDMVVYLKPRLYQKNRNNTYRTHKYGTNLRLHKPPLLSATSIAGLEMIGRVDSNAMVGVIQCGKVIPGGAKMKVLKWKIKAKETLKGQFTPKSKIHISPLTCGAIYQSR